MNILLNSQITNKDGMAMVETLPFLFIFILCAAYFYGAFGVTHTAILNSISTRNYVYETMRNRSDVTYFRDIPNRPIMFHSANREVRIHGTINEYDMPVLSPDPQPFASERTLRMGMPGLQVLGRTRQIHNQTVYEGETGIGQRNQSVEVSPIWIKSRYGICINSNCGD